MFKIFKLNRRIVYMSYCIQIIDYLDTLVSGFMGEAIFS